MPDCQHIRIGDLRQGVCSSSIFRSNSSIFRIMFLSGVFFWWINLPYRRGEARGAGVPVRGSPVWRKKVLLQGSYPDIWFPGSGSQSLFLWRQGSWLPVWLQPFSVLRRNLWEIYCSACWCWLFRECFSGQRTTTRSGNVKNAAWLLLLWRQVSRMWSKRGRKLWKPATTGANTAGMKGSKSKKSVSGKEFHEF